MVGKHLIADLLELWQVRGMFKSIFAFAIQIGGSGLINQLVTVLLIALCAAVVYVMGWFFFRKNPPFPALVLYIWQGFFVLVGGLIVINFLLGLGGHPLVTW